MFHCYFSISKVTHADFLGQWVDFEKTFQKTSIEVFYEKTIKIQISDKLCSIAKLIYLSEKTSQEVFSGIFVFFLNKGKLEDFYGSLLDGEHI